MASDGTPQKQRLKLAPNLPETVTLQYEKPLLVPHGPHGPFYNVGIIRQGEEMNLTAPYHVGLYIEENFSRGDEIEIGQFQGPTERRKTWKINGAEVPYVKPEESEESGHEPSAQEGITLSLDQAIEVLQNLYAECQQITPDPSASGVLAGALLDGVLRGQISLPQTAKSQTAQTPEPSAVESHNEPDLYDLLQRHNVLGDELLNFVNAQMNKEFSSLDQLPENVISRVMERLQNEGDLFASEIRAVSNS